MTDKTLAGTSPEDRAGLLRFGATPPDQCAVYLLIDDVLCRRPAPWFVMCEDAHSGVTTNGHYNPARVGTHVCAEHLQVLDNEPRKIFYAGFDEEFHRTPVRVIEIPGVSR